MPTINTGLRELHFTAPDDDPEFAGAVAVASASVAVQRGLPCPLAHPAGETCPACGNVIAAADGQLATGRA